MKTRTFVWLMVIAIIIISLIAFWDKIVAAIKTKTTAPGIPGTKGANGQPIGSRANGTGAVGVTGNGFDPFITLKQGSKGDEVIELQRLLNDNYHAGLTEDGNFGPATTAALQSAYGVTEINLNDAWYKIYLPVGSTNPAISGYDQYFNVNGTATDNTSWWDNLLSYIP